MFFYHITTRLQFFFKQRDVITNVFVCAAGARQNCARGREYSRQQIDTATKCNITQRKRYVM